MLKHNNYTINPYMQVQSVLKLYNIILLSFCTSFNKNLVLIYWSKKIHKWRRNEM